MGVGALDPMKRAWRDALGSCFVAIRSCLAAAAREAIIVGVLYLEQVNNIASDQQ